MSENMTMEATSLTANEVEFETIVKGYLKQVDEDLAVLPPLDKINGDFGLAYQACNFDLPRAEAGLRYFYMSASYHYERLAVRAEIYKEVATRGFVEREDKIAELKKEYGRILRSIEKKTKAAD